MNFIPAPVSLFAPTPNDKNVFLPRKKIIGQKVWNREGDYFVILSIDWQNAYIEVQNVQDLTKLKMTWEYFDEIWIKDILQ